MFPYQVFITGYFTQQNSDRTGVQGIFGADGPPVPELEAAEVDGAPQPVEVEVDLLTEEENSSVALPDSEWPEAVHDPEKNLLSR